MNTLAIVKDFFDEKWIQKIKLFVKIQQNSAVWTNNRIFFPNNLVEGSGLILVNMIPSPFDLELQDFMIEKGILKHRCNFFTGLLYQGEPNSYIKWHYDGKADFTTLKRCGISVYLNDEWDSSWGGWFSFQNDSKFIQSYVPEFNSAVVLLKDVNHCTTPISIAAKTSRLSIQMFFDMDSLNAEYFKNI
jgi:hypothetical protein